MITRITQAQADDAAAEAARFWPELGRRWPWTRAADVAPVYLRAGELTVALLRAFPAIQWSNQARWYRRDVRDTPAIIAMASDALQDELRSLSLSGSASVAEGKHVHTLIYLVESGAPSAPDGPGAPSAPDGPGAPGAPGAPDSPGAAAAPEEQPVAKTLLASTELDAPFYQAQLAHELLNCFCSTSWDGQTLRSGVRQSSGARMADQTRGAALNDLLLDAMLVHFLPAVTSLQPADLFDGAQGPYWRIARTLSARLRGVPALPALFSAEPDTVERMERGMAVALDSADAAAQVDALVAAHDWQGLRRLIGEDD